MSRYEPVIGLEVHAQLSTRSKIFCGCSTEFGADPNLNTCPVCLGMPGTLPVLNRSAVEFAVRMALATGCEIHSQSVFARKNYFYPDLPKGYQISQYDQPLCERGHVEIDIESGKKRIGITRIHLEEDAGKSIHDRSLTESYVDLNRCGTPLIEIVSEPDLRNPQEAYAYLVKLKQILQYLDVCDGNMEEGSLRCDANISVRLGPDAPFGTKTELKNMNSFKNVEQALTYEIGRQTQVLEGGGKIEQETLLWDPGTGTARSMRGKESAHDYRYFPEPDLVMLDVSGPWIDAIRKALPELPEAKRERFVKDFGLPPYDAAVLTDSRPLSAYYEAAVKAYDKNPKSISNWVMVEVGKVLNEKNQTIGAFGEICPPQYLASLVKMIDGETISGKIAKTVFEEMAQSGEGPEKIVEKRGLLQVSDPGAIADAVKKVLEANPAQVEKYKSGKTNVFGFFVGEVLKATQGKANPKLVNELLRKSL